VNRDFSTDTPVFDSCPCSIGGVWEYGAVPKRRIIVNLATSADGYIAGPDGNLDWLTSRPIPKGFYGLGTFSRSVDA